MVLSRGLRSSEDPSHVVLRDSYSLDCVTGSLNPGASNGVLQQQLTGFLHNSYPGSYLQQGAPRHCAAIQADAPRAQPNLYGSVSSSMGFFQEENDRNSLFDDLLPLGNHELPYSTVEARVASRSPQPTVPLMPFTGLHAHSAQAAPTSVPVTSHAMLDYWGEGSLVPPASRGKRSKEGFSQDVQPRKKVEKEQNKEAKWKRPTEQAEHILRERQRRDDMTSKFSVLESLLPAGSKRDRSTIVDDSIEYVKNLHHRIKQLHQKKVEMKHAASTGILAVASVKTAQHTTSTMKPSRARLTLLEGPVNVPQPSTDGPGQQKEKPKFLPFPEFLSEEELSRSNAGGKSCVQKLKVFLDLPHQIVVEISCLSQPHLQSNILKCLENLHLDVLQCSITNVAHQVNCIISAKPRGDVVSTDSIMAALKYALGPYE